jgi:hypothetical protein
MDHATPLSDASIATPPAASSTRLVAVLEAVTGFLYLTVRIARLVALCTVGQASPAERDVIHLRQRFSRIAPTATAIGALHSTRRVSPARCGVPSAAM